MNIDKIINENPGAAYTPNPESGKINLTKILIPSAIGITALAGTYVIYNYICKEILPKVSNPISYFLK